MRQIMLDTETTGLDYRLGHRVIEIGGVELVGRKLTGQRFHRYLNPEREIDAGAAAVHGINDEFLLDKPRFAEIADELIEFLRGAELVIHNAPFDVGFLNNELGLAGKEPLESHCSGIVDTLKMARELRPGRRNSLDALCQEYAVDNSGRQLHGALLDAELLADVYLAITRGQESLIMDLEVPAATLAGALLEADKAKLRIRRADAAELADHDRVLAEIGKECGRGASLWQAG